jgi:signal transduction histidine kinase/DNA-binding NarL/FixJ family response regulator
VNEDVRHRVLLVEDDEMHAELVQRAFEDTPTVSLIVARRMDEARSVLEHTRPDMVVADLNLPDGKGIELVAGARYPVVIMTSQGSEAAAVEAMKAGALDYVIKSEAMFLEMPHVVVRALREWSHMEAHARANRFLQAQYLVASALARSSSIESAGPEILEIVCRRVGWAVGEFWRLDSTSGLLRRAAWWSGVPGLETLSTGDSPVPSDAGVAGATLREGRPLSIRDVQAEQSFGYPRLARDSDLRGAFGFPVESGDESLGVLTFFSLKVQPPDDDLGQLLDAVSNQVAGLVLRQRVEEDRTRLQAELIERERMAVIGRTAAILGHEIANPLNGMYLTSQLLQRRLVKTPGADPRLLEGIERIMEENRRLNGLLDEFRLLSRRHEIKCVPTEIGKLLGQVLGIQEQVAKQDGITVDVEIAASLPVVEVDDAKLGQVLTNLTKNAIEAMAGGEGGVLTVRALTAGSNLIIEVEDTGPGIPANIDVFEPFQTTKASGTGLGLPVARQIIAAHRGTLEHVPSSGPGAKFRVVLPVLG